MVEVKVTRQVEEIIRGPTKEPDPGATPYDDCITYEKGKNKNKNEKNSFRNLNKEDKNDKI
jgi:hypothetical protein